MQKANPPLKAGIYLASIRHPKDGNKNVFMPIMILENESLMPKVYVLGSSIPISWEHIVSYAPFRITEEIKSIPAWIESEYEA
jgi:hypothetical protein